MRYRTAFGRETMEIGDLLRSQYETGHRILKGVLADVPATLLNASAGQGTVGSIGSIYAHIVFAEDTLTSVFRGQPTLYEAGSWAERLRIPMPGAFQTAEWSAAVTIDPAVFDEYASAVFAATEKLAGSLTGADLERVVEGIMGNPAPAAMLVGNIGVIHISEHAGEIAAIKGVHGLKGLGF
jgi:hypothetical protein